MPIVGLIVAHRKLDWVDEETGKKAEKFNKIVILKNMYTQQELDVSWDSVSLFVQMEYSDASFICYIGRSNFIAGIKRRCPRRMRKAG